jgi:hypothetical protein
MCYLQDHGGERPARQLDGGSVFPWEIVQGRVTARDRFFFRFTVLYSAASF